MVKFLLNNYIIMANKTIIEMCEEICICICANSIENTDENR